MANYDCHVIAQYHGLPTLEDWYDGIICSSSREIFTHSSIKRVLAVEVICHGHRQSAQLTIHHDIGSFQIGTNQRCFLQCVV